MKPTFILGLLIFTHFLSTAQVPDSTFGEPSSFEGVQGAYWPAITGCDFVGREDRSFAALFLSNGKILLAGHSHGSDSTDFALVRLLQDGTFDTTAGPEGQIRMDLGYQHDSCLAAALYENNLVVMGGCVKPSGQSGYALLVARVDPDGQPDTEFGGVGHAVVNLPTDHEMITKIIALPDGKILIAGNAFFGNSFDFPDSTTVFAGRLLPNGQIDSTFGAHGFIYRRYEYTCKASLLGDIVLDSQGRIILSGASYSPYPGNIAIDDLCTHNIHVCRYTSEGQPDANFGIDGVVELPYTEGRAITMHVDEFDRILVAGVVTDLLLTKPVYTFLTRLLPNGTPDGTFANNGRFVKYILGSSSSSEPVDILEIGDRYYLGHLDDVDGEHSWFGLIAIKTSGVVDSTFGWNGVYDNRIWLPNPGYFTNQIHTLDSQSIYISGYYNLFGQDNMMIAKINLNGLISSVETGISDTPTIQLFPNPVENGSTFYFDCGNANIPSEPIQIRVMDMQGKLLFSQWQTVTEGVNPIEMPFQHSGLYIVSFTGKNFQKVVKLVV